MKKLIYSFSLMVALSTLFACNNEEEPISENKTLPVCSFFRGYLNDEYICIEQKDVANDIRFQLKETLLKEDTILLFRWSINFAQDYNNKDEYKQAPVLSIQFAPLQLGNYNIVSDAYYDAESTIIFNDGKNEYIPSPDNPFQIYLSNIIKDSPYSYDPLIRGVMEGTLYNASNPKDSIVFHDIDFRFIPNFLMIRQYLNSNL